MNSEEISSTRYSHLVELWIHHNSAQLQWPAVVISANTIILMILLQDVLNTASSLSLWGPDLPVRVGVGLPLLLTGVGTSAILYTMARARRIMLALEGEIAGLEPPTLTAAGRFSALNHPSGASGPVLLRCYMIILAGVTTLAGLIIALGLILGVAVWLTLVGGWIAITTGRILQNLGRRANRKIGSSLPPSESEVSRGEGTLIPEAGGV